MKDFIPYDLYLKLKEIGVKFNNNEYLYADGTLCKVNNFYNISPYEYAPTISDVLKLLRKEKKIFIDVRTSIDLNGNEHFSYYVINNGISVREGYTDFDWDWEDAALAGIEYVINNLI